jgi:hypothetical protein
VSAALQPGISQETVIEFPRREPVQLDADLKAFLDEVIIPGLIREAMEELHQENLVELNPPGMEDCAPKLIAEVAR